MAVDFRCEKCGKLLSMEAKPNERIKCPYCKAKVQVPAGLAALPHPQMPAGGSPPPAPVAVGAGLASDELVYEQPDPLMATMSKFMPWVISLFFHAGALVIMAFLTIMVMKGTAAPADTTTPDIDVQGNGSNLKPGSGNNSDLAPRSRDRSAKEGGWSQYASATPVSGAALGPEPGLDGLGESTGAVSLHGIAGTSGIGVAAGGGGGPLAAFGLASGGGGGGGPRARFYNMPTKGDAYHIVYVVDRSGSMLDTFDDVRKELKNSIYRLNEKQTFHVVFFSSGALTENPPKRLVKADADAKRVATEYLKDVRPVGQTDPIPAIKRAFEVLAQAPSRQGKVIFMLTDGEFPDNDAVLKAIRALNADKSVHINTILHRYKIESMMKLLQTIADENNGAFKFVEVPD